MKAKPKFLGVCSAIANRYNIDVLLTRIAVLILIITTGIVPGLLIYFIASFLVED